VPYRSTPYGLVLDARRQMLTGRDRPALPLTAKIIMEAAILV
jgi:hypothetical protein